MKNYLWIPLFFGTLIFAQTEESINNWNKSGKASLLFNQATFSNWVLGGEDNVSLNFIADYTFNYKKETWTWDTTFLLDYGFAKNSGSSFYKKTSDRFEIQSLLGKRFAKLWSYSAFLGFKTPITNGYAYSIDENGDESRIKTAGLLSPAYLQFGLGVSWKETDNLWVNIAPISPRITFVNKTFTEKLSANESYFGVDQGKSSRFELGPSINGYWLCAVFENVTLEHRLGLYTNYFEKIKNVDLDYQATLNLKVNKHISANVIVHLLYDDNAVQELQVREVFGVGIQMELK